MSAQPDRVRGAHHRGHRDVCAGPRPHQRRFRTHGRYFGSVDPRADRHHRAAESRRPEQASSDLSIIAASRARLEMAKLTPNELGFRSSSPPRPPDRLPCRSCALHHSGQARRASRPRATTCSRPAADFIYGLGIGAQRDRHRLCRHHSRDRPSSSCRGSWTTTDRNNLRAVRRRRRRRHHPTLRTR